MLYLHRFCSPTYGGSRICSFAFKAILRDAGSDTGTFHGKKDEESVRQLGENETVVLGEGDRIGFGPGDSELYRQARGFLSYIANTVSIPAVEIENR